MSEGKIFDFKHLKDSFVGKNGYKILLVIGFLGIGLIFLSTLLPSNKNPSASTTSAVNSDEYSKQVENKLENIISQINGVGKVNVMVTLESGVEYVYEQDVKSTTDKSQDNDSTGRTQQQTNENQENTPVIIDNGNGGQQALLKTQVEPKIQGVVVVCDGGDNAIVKETVVDTVTTLLDLPSTSVSVSKRVK